MSVVIEAEEPFDPLGVCFGGSGAQMAEGGRCANLVKESGLMHRRVLVLRSPAAHPAHWRCYAAGARSITRPWKAIREAITHDLPYCRGRFTA